MLRSIFIAVVVTGALSAQINSSTGAVTVTASLGQNLPPDQVTYQVTIESDLSTSFDTVSAALKGTDLAGAFTGVYSNQSNHVLDWFYDVTVPLTAMKDETATLTVIQAKLAQGKIPLTLTYSVQGTTTSAQACSLVDLVGAARTQAQQLARGANLTLGNLSNLSTSVSTRIGPTAPLPYIVPSCSLAATFGEAPRTLTVAASRGINASPDQATIRAYVYTPATGTLDDALAALSGTGTTAANLQWMDSNGQGLQWAFSVATSLAGLNDSVAAFQKAQQSVTPRSSVRIDFSVSGATQSQALIDAQDCSKASLVADAQAHARRVAAAANVGLGGIVAVSGGSGQATSGIYAYVANTQFIYDPFGSASLIGTLWGAPAPSACSVTVTFGIQ